MNYPQLFNACETISLRSQRKFFSSRAIELTCLVLAGAFGEISSTCLHGITSILSVVLFLCALAIRVSGIGDRAEKRWYDARAASESIKSASWQYAVHLPPYDTSNDESRASLIDLLHRIIELLPNLDVPAASEAHQVVTDQMQTLRDSNPENRAAEYERDRLHDQMSWYKAKSDWNRKHSALWRGVMIVTESTAVLLGILRVFGVFDVNWIGILAATSAAFAAWQQTRNYTFLSESYAVTSHELSLVADSLSHAATNEDWIAAANDAESAFSREHTLWLARRAARH